MAPPDDAVVPELFDLVRVIAPRYASGELSPAWASYVYTTYRQDLVRDRPAGAPRRSRAEIAAELARAVEFFSIRARGEGRAAAGPAEGDFGAVQEWRNERRRAR